MKNGGDQHSEEQDEQIYHDEGLLDSYTKIWESFPEKQSINCKFSRSPNLSHTSPYCKFQITYITQITSQ